MVPKTRHVYQSALVSFEVIRVPECLPIPPWYPIHPALDDPLKIEPSMNRNFLKLLACLHLAYPR